MKQMSLRTFAIATSAFACATLLSFSWSEQRGVSLSAESAQARVGRPLTPVSVAGVARRQNRRAYRYDAAGMSGAEAVNYAGIAAAAGTAAVAGGTGYYRRPYVGTGALAANAYYGGPIETNPYYIQRAYYGNGPWYRYSGWADYKAQNGIVCDPGTITKGPDGVMHVCQ
jgi:hypothetical protein